MGNVQSFCNTISNALQVVPTVTGALTSHAGARDLSRVPVPVGRRIIDHHSAPRFGLAERESPSADEGLCGVPKYNFDTCRDSLKNVIIGSSIPGPGRKSFSLENI
ncbi:hypothetical protein F5Y13DRAFT_158575 [Hypoxylon sp. FL1857]|nr:hypothetical protein F5Y13DRAFT_158575 [Hypoxylon sp. FL1857]